ncbi:MAG: 4Fe-4S dicluster domain-containing protein [Candidatus Eisenbacteria bacterium]|nr:4Fe-4S dicluster domain-containing protein [Candidatus Eisenbacteria bacterium]
MVINEEPEIQPLPADKSPEPESDERVVLSFELRREIDQIIGGNHHNYCYQCGACVAQCPAARFSDRFNPRLIMLDLLLGRADKLLAADSPIWLCTNCYSCYERCPQDVRPVEVIIALKNLAGRKGVAPDSVSLLTRNILKTGYSGVVTPVVHKTREKLGLDPLPEPPVDEMLELLDSGSDERDASAGPREEKTRERSHGETPAGNASQRRKK